MPIDGNYVTGGPTPNAPGTLSDFIKYFSGTDPSTPQPLGTFPVGVVEAGQNVSIGATHTASFDLLTGASADFTPSYGPNGSHPGLTIQAEDGDHTVVLSDGPDLFLATTGNDTVSSFGGRDTMQGGSGHDSFEGGGQSVLIGGTGGDTLRGGLFSSSHDTITAGSGGDKIVVTRGSNTIFGDTNDTIHAGFSQSSHDFVFGGPGPETIYGGRNTEIYGGGQDSIVAGINDKVNLYGADTLMGGSGTNTAYTNVGSHASIQGGQGQLDVYVANSHGGNDSIFGAGGDLTVHLSKSVNDIRHEKTTDGVTNITFAGGQQIHVSNVTLDFTKDHPSS